MSRIYTTGFFPPEDEIGKKGTAAFRLYTADLTVYIRSATTPSVPTDGEYSFSDNVLTPPTGWSTSLPAGSDTLWRTSASVSTYNFKEVVDDIVWTDPVAEESLTTIVVAELSNGIHLFPVLKEETGDLEVTDYSDSGTDIRVYEGTSELTYDGAGTTPGTYTVEITTNALVTPGSIVLDPGGFATLEDYTSANFSSVVRIKVEIVISGTTLSGTTFTTEKYQWLHTGRSSTLYSLSASSPVIVKQSTSSTVSGAHSTTRITGYAKEDSFSEVFGWLTITPFTGSTAETRLASVDLATYASSNPSNPEYPFTPSNGDTYTSYRLQLWDLDPDNILNNERLLDQQTLQVIYEAESGVAASISNDAVILAATSTGVVSDYSNTGTTVQVQEGATALYFRNRVTSEFYPTAAGEFNLRAVGSGITPITSFSGTGTTTATVGNVTAVNSGTANPEILYYIYGRSTSGSTFVIQKRQTFSKQNSVLVYSLETSSDTITKLAPDATTAGTYSTLNIAGYSKEGNASKIRFGWITTTPNTTGIESSRTSVSSNDLVLSPSSGSGVSNYILKMYDTSSGGNLLATKTVNVTFKGADAVYVVATNQSKSVAADYGGTVSSFSDTGILISLYEGNTQLTYNGSGTSNGTWNVTASVTSGSATLGTKSASGLSAQYANLTAMGTDLVTITFTISGKSLGGISIDQTLTQSFTKVKDAKPPLRIEISSNSAAMPASSSGVISDASTSAVTIKLYEGDTLLDYNGVGSSAGTWNVTATTVSGTVTPGTKSSVGSSPNRYASYSAVSGGSMTTETAVIQYSISGTYIKGGAFSLATTQNLSKVRVGSDGAAGATAKGISLNTDRQVFTFDGAGNLNPPSQSAVLTANKQNLSETLVWSYTDNLSTPSGTLAALITNTSETSKTIPSTVFSATPTRLWIKATATGGGAESTYFDSETINRIEDGSEVLVATLSNDVQPIPTNSDGSGGTLTGVAEGQMTVYYGSTNVTDSCTFSEVSEVGCTGDINTATNTPYAGKPKGYYRVTALSADIGNYTMRASYNPGSGALTTDKTFNVVKQKQGIGGTNGTNGTRTAFITLFQWSSTTPSVFPTGAIFTYNWSTSVATRTGGTALGSWSLDIGSGSAGQKLWRIAQAVTNTDTATETTGITWVSGSNNPFTIGAQGSDGLRGSRTFYYSISAVTPPNNNQWSDAQADAAITAAGLTKISLDIVTLYNTSTGFSQTKFWNGSAWTTVEQVIDGNLLVTGSVNAQALNIDGNTIVASGDTLVVGNLNASQITSGTINTSRLNLDGVSITNVGGAVKIGDISAATGTFTDGLDITGEAYFRGTGTSNSGYGGVSSVEINAGGAVNNGLVIFGNYDTGVDDASAVILHGTASYTLPVGSAPALHITSGMAGSTIYSINNRGTASDNAYAGYFSSSNGPGLFSNGGPNKPDIIVGGSTSATYPAITFSGDTDTGVYNPAADTIALTTGGTNRLTISSASLTVVPVVLVSNGTVGSPGIAFASDSNTGIYSTQEDGLGIVTGGTLRVNVTTIVTSSSNTIQATGNTTPTTGVGVELSHSGSEGYIRSINRGTATNTPLSLSASTLTLQTNTVSIPAGTLGAPGLHFGTDTASGLYRGGTNNVRMVSNGETCAEWNTNGLAVAKHIRLQATAPASSSSTGLTGQVAVDSNYLYVCTATDTWKRVALTTF